MATTGISMAHLKAWRRAAAFSLLVTNLFPALYTGLIHQRGTLDVMSRLQTLCDVSNVSTRLQPDVLFLMPCHSTPFYRYNTLMNCMMGSEGWFRLFLTTSLTHIILIHSLYFMCLYVLAHQSSKKIVSQFWVFGFLCCSPVRYFHSVLNKLILLKKYDVETIWNQETSIKPRHLLPSALRGCKKKHLNAASV